MNSTCVAMKETEAKQWRRFSGFRIVLGWLRIRDPSLENLSMIRLHFVHMAKAKIEAQNLALMG